MARERKVVAVLWQSADGARNAVALQANNPTAFEALAEVDALGHRILATIDRGPADGPDLMAGMALLRRSVTLFAACRRLCESSLLDPAKLQARALFETLLAVQFLVHGGNRAPNAGSPLSHARRMRRARFFYVAAERRRVYAMQWAIDAGYTSDGVVGRRRLQAETGELVASLKQRYGYEQRRFGAFRCYATEPKKRRYYDGDEWYTFGFSGKRKVGGLQALAEKLGRRKEYDMMYSPMSGVTHPRGFTHDLLVDPATGIVSVLHVHHAQAFDLVVAWSGMWQILTLLFLARVYVPGRLDDAEAVARRVAPEFSRLRNDIPPGWL